MSKILSLKRYLFADRIKVKKRDSGINYLIYRFDGHSVGIMTKMLTVLGWLNYATENNMVLVVEMTDSDVFDGKGNAWEYFFQQPMIEQSCSPQMIGKIIKECNYGIAPVSARFHYMFGKKWAPVMKMLPPKIAFPGVRDYKEKPDMHNNFRRLYKEYIRFRPEVQIYLDTEYDQCLSGKGKILGVRTRGTDYVQHKPYNHPIQPDVEDVAKMAEKLQTEKGWDYIYLATEEKKIEDYFNACFPGRIIINERRYLDGDYRDRFLHEAKQDRVDEFYWRELEYLSSMNLLSKCDMLIGGLCGGSQGVMIMKEDEFEYCHFFDSGNY